MLHALFAATLLAADPAPPDATHQLRVKKAELLVEAFYDHRGAANFSPYCDFLVTQHEGLEAAGVAKGYPSAEGYGAAWWYSMVYGGANFSLRCYATAPGSCAGPMDVKHYPLVRDPERNVAWHVDEMWGFYKRGVRGLDLCEHVFYPAAPHDWGGGRFRRTDQKHRERIELAYQRGELP